MPVGADTPLAVPPSKPRVGALHPCLPRWPLSSLFCLCGEDLGGRLLKLPCSQGFSENDQGRVTPTGMPRGPLWSCDLKFGGFVSIKNAIGSGRPSALDDQRPPCMIEGGADLVTWSRGPACPRSTRSETSAQISDGFGHGGRGADGTPAPPPASHTRGPCTGSRALTHVLSLTWVLITRFYFLVVSPFDGWQTPVQSKYKQIRSDV